jgi:hypothetical protein
LYYFYIISTNDSTNDKLVPMTISFFSRVSAGCFIIWLILIFTLKFTIHTILFGHWLFIPSLFEATQFTHQNIEQWPLRQLWCNLRYWSLLSRPVEEIGAPVHWGFFHAWSLFWKSGAPVQAAFSKSRARYRLRFWSRTLTLSKLAIPEVVGAVRWGRRGEVGFRRGPNSAYTIYFKFNYSIKV